MTEVNSFSSMYRMMNSHPHHHILLQHYGPFAYFLEFVELRPLTFLFGLVFSTFLLVSLVIRNYNQDEELASLKHEAENEISVLRGHLDNHAKMMATFTRDIRDALAAIREQQASVANKKVNEEIYILKEPNFKLTTKLNTLKQRASGSKTSSK